VAVREERVPEVLELLRDRLRRITERCGFLVRMLGGGDTDRTCVDDPVGACDAACECWHGRTAEVVRDIVDGQFRAAVPRELEAVPYGRGGEVLFDSGGTERWIEHDGLDVVGQVDSTVDLDLDVAVEVSTRRPLQFLPVDEREEHVGVEASMEEVATGGLFGEAGEDAPRLVEGADVTWGGVGVADAQSGSFAHVRSQHQEAGPEPWRAAVVIDHEIERSVDGMLT
jgi:hypothetical protein